MNADGLDEVSYADLESEAIVLGAAMLSPAAAATVLERTRGEHYRLGAHVLVFEAIEVLQGRGAPTDVIAVKGALEDRGTIGLAGGAAKLHTLIASVPTTSNVDFYIDRILEKAEQEGIARAALRLRQVARDPDLSRDGRMDAAWQAIEAATNAAVTAEPMVSAAELVFPLLDRLEKGSAEDPGIPIGWADLRSFIPSLKPGQLVTIGARPGVGKSVVMANLAYHVAVEHKIPTFLGSLEMSRDELMLRMFSRSGKVDLGRLMDPDQLTADDWERLHKAQQILVDAQTLIIDDDPSMGVAYIRSRLRTMRRKGIQPGLVIVDYLQLMQSGKSTESRQVEVSQFSRSLKVLAKEFAVPVVVGSQLNRAVEHRSTKRPMASDLRESGAVEQDSDVIILLHREDAYDPESARAGEIDFIVDKNRNGPRGTATCAFQGHYSRVVDMAKIPWSPTGGLQ